MKKLSLIVILVLTGLFFLSCNQQKTTVHGLRCEYLENPLAINNPTPLLSWQLQSKERGKLQSAYRILVAGNPSLLNETDADYWDSGIVQSGQSVNVVYAGKPLASREQLYWKVMVWDEYNQPTAWSKVATWGMGLLQPDDWTAQWIADREDDDPNSTLTYPAPYFRKEFKANKTVKQAKAYVCGLGFYEMYINGNKVGDQVMAPAVTNFDKREIQKILYQYDDQSTQRVLYNAFDVTSLVSKGNNTIGLLLGNGWYNQRARTVEGCLWYDTPRAILQLEVEYTDGTTERVQTDGTWKCTTGPLLTDAIFTGEEYDARLELGDWSKNGYDDSAWQPVLAVRAPTGKLEAQLAPFDKVIRTIKPAFDGKLNDSTYLYSLPEMISGWAQLQVKGAAGSRIELRFVGEEEQDFGQADYYTLKGEGTERWEPRFTWHAFRTIKAITRGGLELNENSLTVKVVNTDAERAGDFTCSNPLFNKLYESYVRTQEANFHGSISSDCPHRERIGYTGDGQVVVESSLLTYNMSQFYQKWFNDMDDARNKNTGYVPHTAPFAGGGGGPAWGSAYVIMPWAYYCYYADTALLKQHYTGMKQWVTYLGTRTDERGIVVREEPNGWCLGDWCTPEPMNMPEPLVNTAYYYHVTDLMGKVATVLNKNEDVLFFSQLKQQIKTNFNTVFFNTETNSYWEGRQGSDVLPLAFGLVPDENKQEVFNSLLTHLEKLDYHFDTGILATPLLLSVLTENGRADVAYRLMDQKTYPSYSYLLDDKYTCLWEDWHGRSSRCHPMFGSVVAWFYNTLAGIRFDESQPGMRHIIIAPQPTGDLTQCSASYRSLYGTVSSSWQINNGNFELKVEIPANTTATVFMPNEGDGIVTESGKPVEDTPGLVYHNHKATVLTLGSGTFNFVVKNN